MSTEKSFEFRDPYDTQDLSDFYPRAGERAADLVAINLDGEHYPVTTIATTSDSHLDTSPNAADLVTEPDDIQY